MDVDRMIELNILMELGIIMIFDLIVIIIRGFLVKFSGKISNYVIKILSIMKLMIILLIFILMVIRIDGLLIKINDIKEKIIIIKGYDFLLIILFVFFI